MPVTRGVRLRCVIARRLVVDIARRIIPTAERTIRLHQYPDCLIESRNLLLQLPPSDEHGADNRRDIGAVFQTNFDLPIKSQASLR